MMDLAFEFHYLLFAYEPLIRWELRQIEPGSELTSFFPDLH